MQLKNLLVLHNLVNFFFHGLEGKSMDWKVNIRHLHMVIFWIILFGMEKCNCVKFTNGFVGSQTWNLEDECINLLTTKSHSLTHWSLTHFKNSKEAYLI